MANRCPDCNKFVGLEAGDPEEETPVIEGSEVLANVRVVLNCAECGTEMSEWAAELAADLPEGAEDHMDKHVEDGAGFDFELEVEWESTPEVSDDYRSRKPPTINKKTGLPRPVPFRYQTHYYSVAGMATVKCSCGEELGTVELSDELESSSFDSLV